MAALKATEHDLQFSRACTLVLRDAKKEGIQLRALWSSALVYYVRGLNDKHRKWIRKRLEKRVAELPGEPLKLHQWLKDMRDKNIAHDVNPYDEIIITLILTPEDHDHNDVLGVGAFFRIFQGGPENAENMLKLMDAMLSELDEMIKVESASVKKEARARPMDELRKLPVAETTAPGPEKAGKRK